MQWCYFYILTRFQWQNQVQYAILYTMSFPSIYTLHFDGSCGPKNPGGTAAFGYTLHNFADLLASDHGVIGSGPEMSNNVAEYYALCKGFEAVIDRFITGYQKIICRGDSRLVVNQMSKKWKATGGLYFPYYKQAVELAKHIRSRGPNVTFEWVPREHNQMCDDLSKVHRVGQ